MKIIKLNVPTERLVKTSIASRMIERFANVERTRLAFLRNNTAVSAFNGFVA